MSIVTLSNKNLEDKSTLRYIIEGRLMEAKIEKIRRIKGCPICAISEIEGEKQIKSHLVPRLYQEIVVGKHGEMYHYDIKKDDYNNNKKLKQISKYKIKKATAHVLFCKKHDSELFDLIERKENDEIKYNSADKRQNFMLAFRAHVFNLFESECKVEYHKKYKNQNRRVSKSHILKKTHIYKILLQQFIKDTSLGTKYNFDSKKLVINEGNNILNTKVFRINKKIEFLSSCCIPITDSFNLDSSCYYINTIPGLQKSFIVISYLKKSKMRYIAQKYMKKLDNLYRNDIKGFELEISKMLIVRDSDLLISSKLKELFSQQDFYEYFDIINCMKKQDSKLESIKAYLNLKKKSRNFKFNLFLDE